MINTAALIRLADGIGVALDEQTAARLDRYAELLVDWNTRMNLTAITAPDDILIKHFLDSLTLLPALGEARSLIDVGTGAGFPGMVAAIVRPELNITLLDSLKKRLGFLEAVAGELGVKVTCLHARAEDAGHDPVLRERFDVVTARAVAALPVLSEYCLPLVKVGGRFIAMKSRLGLQELADAKAALQVLGGRVSASDGVMTYTLPAGVEANTASAGDEAAERLLILVDKIAATPKKYPRPAAKIAKQPI